eukprot:scaffold3161_cov146-Amphora_coffeaeformis.AAC.3
MANPQTTFTIGDVTFDTTSTPTVVVLRYFGRRYPHQSITGPGHETPLVSGVSTNVSVDVNSRQHDSEADVDAHQHDPGQDQDQPAFNRLWNNQYVVLMELDI